MIKTSNAVGDVNGSGALEEAAPLLTLSSRVMIRFLPTHPDILDGVDDLMQLGYLNESSVLYNLQHRYNLALGHKFKRSS
jgi:myosin heavy subunit